MQPDNWPGVMPRRGKKMKIFMRGLGWPVLRPMSFASLLCCCALVAHTAMAGQTININTDPTTEVYGNSNTPDGSNRSLTPSNNTLNLNATTTGLVYGGYASLAANSSSSANFNTVNVSSIAVSGATIYGGHAIGNASNPAIAQSNTVNVDSGAQVNHIFGARVSGGSTATTVDASSNKVVIEGGIIQGGVTGGFTTATNEGASSYANFNSVTINRGTFSATDNIYGGHASVVNAAVANAHADNNTITISGSPSMATTSLYGGMVTLSGGGESSNPYSGNRLVVNTSSLSVANVRNFQIFDFVLPETTDASAPILTVSGTAVVTGATINIGVEGSSTALQVGDSLTLISATTLTNDTPNKATAGSSISGISTQVLFTLEDSATDLVAKITAITVGGGQAGVQMKSLSESRMSGLGVLSIGADMLEMQAMPQIRSLAPYISGMTPFAVMGASTMRYKSGSHVDVDGFTLATGVGWNSSRSADCSNLMLGAFFEAGWGNYDSHNSFSSAPTVRGEGNSRFYGGGILARYDTSFGLYTEGSFRMGEVKTDYDSNDFVTTGGSHVDYDSDALYYGAHLGLGYIWKLTGQSGLDMYAKYHWTRQDSDTVRIRGDRFKFKTMDSHRTRLGGRYFHTFTTASGACVSPYAGAAYEYEFDSKSKASVNGFDLAAPSVKGSTGMGELGVRYRPSSASRMSLDIGVQGYVGKREGVRGSIAMAFTF